MGGQQADHDVENGMIYHFMGQIVGWFTTSWDGFIHENPLHSSCTCSITGFWIFLSHFGLILPLILLHFSVSFFFLFRNSLPRCAADFSIFFCVLKLNLSYTNSFCSVSDVTHENASHGWHHHTFLKNARCGVYIVYSCCLMNITLERSLGTYTLINMLICIWKRGNQETGKIVYKTIARGKNIVKKRSNVTNKHSFLHMGIMYSEIIFSLNCNNFLNHNISLRTLTKKTCQAMTFRIT